MLFAGCSICWGVKQLKRTRDYLRFQRKQHINRKIGILRRYGDLALVDWLRDCPGRLSKGKIHCSCPMCREKSYDDWSVSDKRDIISAKQQEDEFFRR